METHNISTFAHIIPLQYGRYALFSALWLRVIFFDESLLPFVQSIKNGLPYKSSLRSIPPKIRTEASKLFVQMKDEEFLNPENDDKKIMQIRKAIDDQDISIMYLIVTSNCNLACSYCYLSELLEEKPNQNMRIDTARKAIDLFSKNIRRNEVHNPEIIFYGGEPLLNLDLIEFALDYASKVLPNCRFVLNTNGTFVNEKAIQIMKKYNIEVGLSIDGTKAIHDSCRVDKGGKGTFDRAMTGYRKLVKKGINVGISCTITPQNVKHLTKITEWLINEEGTSALGFNLLIGPPVISEDDYSKKAAQALLDSYQIAWKAGVYEERMARRVNAFSDGVVSLNDCGGCGLQVVITPDEKIGVCQAFMNTGENFMDLTQIDNPQDHELWSLWRKRSPFNMEHCLKCEALGICGGGCPYNSQLRYGNFMQPDLTHCEHAKLTLRFLLQELLNVTLNENKTSETV